MAGPSAVCGRALRLGQGARRLTAGSAARGSLLFSILPFSRPLLKLCTKIENRMLHAKCRGNGVAFQTSTAPKLLRFVSQNRTGVMKEEQERKQDAVCGFNNIATF